MRSSSSVAVNSMASASFPVSSLTWDCWSGVRSMRTKLLSWFGVVLMARTPVEEKAVRSVRDDTRGDALLELGRRQLDGFGLLARLLQHLGLLGGREVDAHHVLVLLRIAAHDWAPEEGLAGRTGSELGESLRSHRESSVNARVPPVNRPFHMAAGHCPGLEAGERFPRLPHLPR